MREEIFIQRYRPGHPNTFRQVQLCKESLNIILGTRNSRRAYRRGQTDLRPLIQLVQGKPCGIPPDQRLLHRRWRRGRHHNPTLSRRTYQRGRIKPAPQRGLRGTQRIKTQHRIGVQKQGRRITAERHRLSPRGGNHQRRFGTHRSTHMIPRRRNYRNPPESTPQLLCGAQSPHGTRTPLIVPALCAPPLLRQTPTPRATRHRSTRRQREWPPACITARGHAAPLARKRRDIAAARNLHQHRSML